ncbi:MAG: alpha/beta fold hydrolase [Paracoccaceae bacterium]|nr:alpha/beta fold hydrolase [Paracoccaceae bacterium]
MSVPSEHGPRHGRHPENGPPPDLPPDWPNRSLSRTVHLPPIRWHVQDSGGSGPVVLLLHGAGASCHSWRDVLPILGRKRRVIAIDLPGQGFSRLAGRDGTGLDDMARAIGTLIAHEGWHVDALIGHSAGAAVALRLCLDLAPPPRAVVGINAALGTFEGLSGVLFPLMARVLAGTSLTAQVFAATASVSRARRLLSETGSTISDAGVAQYLRLMRDPLHVDGTLTMMARWQLEALNARLPGIALPVLFIVGDADRAVPPTVSRTAARGMPDARVEHLPGLGHLCHEEAPDEVCRRIDAFLGPPP